MKIIKMRTIYAGPDGNCGAGEQMIVDDKKAKVLVDAGYAEYIGEPEKKAVVEEKKEEEYEVAEVRKIENATKNPPKRRRKRSGS